MLDLNIPRDVADAFFNEKVVDVESVTGGKLNNSMSVTLEGGSQYILQKINESVGSNKYDNFSAVNDYLKKCGWEMPDIVTVNSSKNKIVFVDKSNERWCAFLQLTNDEWNSDPAPLGQLLAKLHKDLAEFNYKPLGEPLIIDSVDRFNQLIEVKDKLPNMEAKKLANELADLYKKDNGLPEYEKQLVHADCKIENLLYKKGKPYTFIGWKTLMEGNIWLDIGDMMRSIAKFQLANSGEVDPSKLEKYIRSYHKENSLGLDLSDFRRNALQATKHITLVLAMRYLSDFKDQGYFSWNNTKYKSRFDHNLVRAKARYEIYKSLS